MACWLQRCPELRGRLSAPRERAHDPSRRYRRPQHAQTGTRQHLLLRGIRFTTVLSLYACCLGCSFAELIVSGRGSFYGGAPDVSPDGRMIVFSGVETTRGSFSDNGDIYTIRIDGTGLKRLTTHTAYDGMPSFSPDGKKIVFVSEHDAPRDRPQVWIMNADGTGRTRLSHSDCREASPSFSRDGRRICFDRYFLPGKNGKPSINLWGAPRSWHVFTMNTDGTSETQLTVNLSTPPRSETSVAFFPNDNMILFLSGMASERNGFWLIDSQGQERTPVGSLNVSTFGQDPVSVRGNEVIVLTAPNALCIWNWDTRDLARVPTGGPPQTLRPDMSQPVLLPNGKDILLLVQEDRRYSCGLGAYWTVGRDGTNWRRVTPNHSLGQHP